MLGLKSKHNILCGDSPFNQLISNLSISAVMLQSDFVSFDVYMNNSPYALVTRLCLVTQAETAAALPQAFLSGMRQSLIHALRGRAS